MKGKWILMALVLLVVAALPLVAMGAQDELQGTWYGGSSNPDNAGYKYQYTFIPTGPNRWYVMADGAYNPDSLGAAVATRWTGEVVKSGGTYEIRMIALTTNDPDEPPEELPTIQAVRGWIERTEKSEVVISYDLYALYDWNQVPFEEDPEAWFLAPGDGVIEEAISRMETEVEFHQ